MRVPERDPTMEIPTPGLAFEQPIYELEDRLQQLLRPENHRPGVEEEIRKLRRELAETIEEHLRPPEPLGNRAGGAAQGPAALERLPGAGVRRVRRTARRPQVRR